MKRTATLGLCLFAANLTGLPAFGAEKPNIILIYADDIGYGDFGCYGGTGVDTPHVDRLAREGLRFTSAYATASTCTPSRYSLLTGLYPFRNKEAQILDGNAPLIIDTARPTLPALLRQQGYRTGLAGKWHLGLGVATENLDWNGDIAPGPREVGFDYSHHMAATNDRVPSVLIENGRIVDLHPDDPVAVSYGKPVGNDPTGASHPQLLKVQADAQHAGTIVDGISRIGTMSGGQTARWADEDLSDRFLGKAIEFIETNRDRPFFLYYAAHENHVPRVPHPRFRHSSRLGVRGDVIAQFDWNVGRILDTLDRLNLSQNTLIILTSDNGPVYFDGYWDGAVEDQAGHDASGPFRGGKYSAFEGGTRMPFIVSWPGRVAPGLSDALLSQLDLFPSLAALVGAKFATDQIDGEDHLEALLGRSSQGRGFLVQQGVNCHGVRLGDWKYLTPGRTREKAGVGNMRVTSIPEPGFLFDLNEDPGETNDLAEKHPDVVKRIRAILATTLARD